MSCYPSIFLVKSFCFFWFFFPHTTFSFSVALAKTVFSSGFVFLFRHHFWKVQSSGFHHHCSISFLSPRSVPWLFVGTLNSSSHSLVYTHTIVCVCVCIWKCVKVLPIRPYYFSCRSCLLGPILDALLFIHCIVRQNPTSFKSHKQDCPLFSLSTQSLFLSV